MSLNLFHPAVANWFAKQFDSTHRAAGASMALDQRAPPHADRRAYRIRKDAVGFSIGHRRSREARAGRLLEDTTHVVYVSPLKALSNDIQKNLQEPLAGIQKELQALGLDEINIRTMVRTGDTPAHERTAMTKRPPHIIVTTPESLYILLTSEGGRRMLQTARTLDRR